QVVAGLSITTTLVTFAFVPRLTVSVFGYVLAAPSQYVVTFPSFAFAATNVCCTDDAVIGFPAARLVPLVAVAVGVAEDVETIWKDCAAVPLHVHCCNWRPSAVEADGTSKHLPLCRATQW